VIGQTWKAFLQNHIEEIAAVDFFLVPTIRLRALFVFLVIEHQRRRVLHFGVTERPTAEWAAQPSLEGFFETPKYRRKHSRCQRITVSGVNYDQGFAPVLPHGFERDPEPAVVRG